MKGLPVTVLVTFFLARSLNAASKRMYKLEYK